MKLTHVSPFSYAEPEQWITIDHSLLSFFGITEAPQVRKTECEKEEGEIEVMGRAKQTTRYGRKVDVLPLWEVVDERGFLLGSLSLQSGGKARFIPRSEEPSCVV